MLTVRVGKGEAPIRHVCGRVGVREELGEGPNREQEEGDGREREDDLDYLERNLGVPVVPKGVAEDGHHVADEEERVQERLAIATVGLRRNHLARPVRPDGQDEEDEDAQSKSKRVPME